VIRLDRISVRRGSALVLDRVALEVGAEPVALVGPSGSGKSTLLRAILGLETPTDGTLTLMGRVASRGGRDLIPTEERNVAMVFQDLALWPHLSVFGNIELGLKARRVPASVRQGRIQALLAAVDLSDKALRRPHELSGGERQRVAIARALALDPVALLLDEPLTSLDVLTKDEILNLLARLFVERERPVIYVGHEPREVVRLVQRIVVLENGRISQQGTLGELDRAPATPFVRAFLRALE
jgi:ABC-type Fe3+/spermidine/putrescine transport system ATPase subunit